MNIKEEFLKIYDENVKRDGAEKLRDYLVKSDFFTAPASSRFHCSFEGGLCEHSVNTYRRLVANLTAEYGEKWSETVSAESAAVCALLHDVCKIDFYRLDYRNAKENGEWVRKPFYLKDELLPYGHGEKSVYIIGGFIRLSREEAMAINWHMGGFDSRVKSGDQSVSLAYSKFPLAVLLHVSDLEATFIDENRNS